MQLLIRLFYTFSMQLLWPAIRDAFNECMAEDFTPETDVAWEHIFEYMSTKFKEGLRKESRHAR